MATPFCNCLESFKSTSTMEETRNWPSNIRVLAKLAIFKEHVASWYSNEPRRAGQIAVVEFD
jgi:hypothetical protein